MEFDFEEKPELNITPLVDVMLVLLAILMVSTPVIVFEENINLPSGSKSKTINKKVTLNIIIDKKKVITFKKQQYDFDTFSDDFILLSKNIDKKSIIYISADKSLKYGDVMYILKSIKSGGFTKVSLVTDG